MATDPKPAMEILESLVMIGPGRRSERTVIDQLVKFKPAVRRKVRDDVAAYRSRVVNHLEACGFSVAENRFHAAAEMPDPVLVLCRWYAETTVLLQQCAGHRVDYAAVVKGRKPGTARAIAEFEESRVGTRAAELAQELIMQALQPGKADPDAEDIAGKISSFMTMAQDLVLPFDTEVLVEAARARDIPCFKLEREPYAGLEGDFRIRKNGLLMFGHGCHRLIVDGTISIDRSGDILPVVHNRLRMNELTRRHRLPVPRADAQSETCVTLSRALRSAHRVGYPVAVKPVAARKGAVSCGIDSDDGLEKAVRLAQQAGSSFLIESHVPGNTYRVLFSGRQFQAVLESGNGRDVTELCDASIIESATRLATDLPAGLLALRFVTTDPARPLEETGGAFVGLDAAPELESMVPPGGELHRSMAQDFVDWLIPAGQPCRVPIFAVTGTNGKTTSCRMLAAIMKQAGFRVGMACTDGVYLDGALSQKGDLSGRNGHNRVFESPEIDLAVLETARGAVLHSGFMFDWCDVAICTNVTAEHLGEYGIDTVRQMGEVKQLVLERARTAVVLNADDPECQRIGRRIGRRLAGRRLCWFSLELDAAAVRRKRLGGDRVLLVEHSEGDDWIVDHQGGRSERILRLADIPATFDGLARHNALNAMGAMAAALEFGIELRVVRDALSGFSMGIETTPGRSNFYHGLGFPVLMDFVQTIDGMRRFCQFAGSLEIEGSRILVISVLGRHDDDTIRGFARFAASAFDRFVCRNYGFTFKRDAEEIPRLLREQLLQEGVADEAITIIHNDTEAMDAALGMAGEGDLVAIMCGHEFQKYWQEIASFKERRQSAEKAG